MAFTILYAAGPVITVKVTGELSRSEVAQIQAASLDVIRRRGKVSALFILEDFKGWKRGDKWVMSHFCLLTTRTSPELPLLETRRGGILFAPFSLKDFARRR
jgi:hypothetical protein